MDADNACKGRDYSPAATQTSNRCGKFGMFFANPDGLSNQGSDFPEKRHFDRLRRKILPNPRQNPARRQEETMCREKRQYDPEFKAAVALEAIKGKFSVGELSEKYALHPSLIHSWRKKIMESAYRLLHQGGEDDAEVREKEKKIERLNQENEFLRQVAQAMPAATRRDAVKVDHPELSLLRQVQLLNINRSGIYYREKRRSRTEAGEASMPSGDFVRCASGEAS